MKPHARKEIYVRYQKGFEVPIHQKSPLKQCQLLAPRGSGEKRDDPL